MSKAQQINLNITLSDKLANYLIGQPKILKKYSGCSYVVFSYENKDLNDLNVKLVIELEKEGKQVIKAQETDNINSPWILTPIYN